MIRQDSGVTVCPWCFGSFVSDVSHDKNACKVANMARLIAEREFLFTGKWPENTPPMRITDADTHK